MNGIRVDRVRIGRAERCQSWFNGAVSKTVEQLSAPGVRIPLSPPRYPGSVLRSEPGVEVRGGDVAQLGEHLVRNEGVGGSNPLISTSCSEIVLGGEVAVS